MLDEALSYFLFLYSLIYQAIVPCSVPELLPVNAVNHQEVRNKMTFRFSVYQNAKTYLQTTTYDDWSKKNI